MSDISEEESNPKSELKFSIKLKQSLDSSIDSQNEDAVYFSSKNLIMKSDLTRMAKMNKKDKMFDSMDFYIKNNLNKSEAAPKSDNKKSSEGISTEPTSIRVKNYNSPRKRFSVFKLIEKDRKSKKDLSRFTIKKEEEKEQTPLKKERSDIFGNVICKKNKRKVKVSFVDIVTTQPLVDVTEIECFKNYNYIYGNHKEEKIEKLSNCQCCIIY